MWQLLLLWLHGQLVISKSPMLASKKHLDQSTHHSSLWLGGYARSGQHTHSALLANVQGCFLRTAALLSLLILGVLQQPCTAVHPQTRWILTHDTGAAVCLIQ